MNAVFAVFRFILAQREKAVLAAMLVLCVLLGVLANLQKDDNGSTDGPIDPKEVLPEWETPRTEKTFRPAHLENDEPIDRYSAVLDRRRSIFRPGAAGTGGGPRGGRDGKDPWPTFLVRQVSQPTPGGAWIAQLDVGGRAYIAREGKSFANGQFELQRIDKTRLCVEVLRRLDDEIREFCKE